MSKEMFGMSESDIREQYMESITAKFSGLEMVVAGILSDCQEIMSTGLSDAIRMQNEDRIRKQLNVAKFILFEMMDAKRANESKYIGEAA